MILSKISMASIAILAMANTALAFDDSQVRAWAVAGITGENQQSSAVPSDALNGRLATDKVLGGWQRLKNCRDSGMSNNLELAAAEHYLFARYLANKDGDTEYRDFPKMYESLKTWATENDLKSYLQTTSEPVSPVSKEVTRWGELGIEQGLEDYKFRTKTETSNKWGSYSEAIGVAYGYYYKYLPPAGPCKVEVK